RLEAAQGICAADVGGKQREVPGRSTGRGLVRQERRLTSYTRFDNNSRQTKITHKSLLLQASKNTLAADQNKHIFVGTRPHTPYLKHQLATVMPHKGAN
ncbi:MAG: hypothetical protein ACRCXB_03065, partial [Aeromonadaceae bacterium]